STLGAESDKLGKPEPAGDSAEPQAFANRVGEVGKERGSGVSEQSDKASRDGKFEQFEIGADPHRPCRRVGVVRPSEAPEVLKRPDAGIHLAAEVAQNAAGRW